MARVGGDLSSLKEQVEQADATFGAGAVIQLGSLVLKSLLLLFTNQQKGVLQPPSSLPGYSFIVFSTQLQSLQKDGNFGVELSRLGEWCRMLQSWQPHLTALHGLLYLHWCSEPCFKTVAQSDFLFFFTVLMTSSGASLLYNNNTD